MAKVSRNQLNVTGFKVNMKTLFNSIKSILASLDYDAGDSKYKYHGKPDAIKEIQFNIVGEKNIDNYSQFQIEVEVNVKSAKPVSEKGKKLLKGKGKIILRSDLILDYDGKWIKNPILHFFKGIYEKYVYRTNIKKYETMIALEMFKVRDELKKLVEMK